MTNSTDSQSPRRFSSLRRWLVRGLIAVVLLASVPVGQQLVQRWLARDRLNETIAHLDSVDPRWRLDDVEADRRAVAPHDNSAAIVVAAHRLLPTEWQSWESSTRDEIEKLAPNLSLPRDLAQKLDAELEPLTPALKKARELESRPIGKHQLRYRPDWLGTPIQDQQNVREIGVLLALDSAASLERKDMTMAWRANRSLLNAARSLGDEPLLVTVLVRLAVSDLAERNLERILGQGELSAQSLEERQRAMEEESQVPLFRIGMRGERAGIHLLLTKFENGELPLLQTMASWTSKRAASPNPWDWVSEYFAHAMVLNSHETLLRMHTNLIEATKLPAAERSAAMEQIDAMFRAEVQPDDTSLILAHLLFGPVTRIAEAEQRVHTKLACAAAAMAAERFRISSRNWPASFAELIEAGFLKTAPSDLYHGEPLRLRRTSDGLVIYSIGADRQYDGAALDKKSNDKNAGDALGDLALRKEFRLWDISERRRSPTTVPVKEPKP